MSLLKSTCTLKSSSSTNFPLGVAVDSNRSLSSSINVLCWSLFLVIIIIGINIIVSFYIIIVITISINITIVNNVIKYITTTTTTT